VALLASGQVGEHMIHLSACELNLDFEGGSRLGSTIRLALQFDVLKVTLWHILLAPFQESRQCKTEACFLNAS
jgi:hypothetical protein